MTRDERARRANKLFDRKMYLYRMCLAFAESRAFQSIAHVPAELGYVIRGEFPVMSLDGTYQPWQERWDCYKDA